MADWNDVADDWVKHADQNDYRNALLMPLALEILGDVRGKRLLDLGCGEGGYCRALAERGADVVGVDGSPRLIEIAKERGGKIEYICANANDLKIDEKAFDVVLAAMSLMDVEDYEGSVAEIARVLRPGGRLVMSITHPCFMVDGLFRSHRVGGVHHRPLSQACDAPSQAAGRFHGTAAGAGIRPAVVSRARSAH